MKITIRLMDRSFCEIEPVKQVRIGHPQHGESIIETYEDIRELWINRDSSYIFMGPDRTYTVDGKDILSITCDG